MSVESLQVSDIFLALTKKVAYLTSDFSWPKVSLKTFLILISKSHPQPACSASPLTDSLIRVRVTQVLCKEVRTFSSSCL